MEVDYLANHQQLIPALAHWHQREWAYLRRSSEPIGARIEKLHRCCGHREIPTVVVAIKNGALLGSAMLIAHDMDGQMELSPWLAGVVVSPDHRDRGIGTALVRRTVSEARALGLSQLHLYTIRQERFYEQLGWEIVRRGYRYKGLHVTVMVRDIVGQEDDSAT